MKRIGWVGLIISFVLLLATHNASAAKAPEKLKAISVKFKTPSQTVEVGNSLKLVQMLTFTPNVLKAKVLYTSSNVKIASVNTQGQLIGIAKGKATITVSVTKEGYAGKGTFTVLVTEKPIVKGPVTYTDLDLLDKDVRAGIQALNKQDYTKLTDSQNTQLQKLLNIDRNQLLVALYEITRKGQPVWSASLVQNFTVHNLENDIGAIANLFSDSSDKDAWKPAYEMLKEFKSPTAIVKLDNVLNTTSNAELRYSLCYVLSKFTNDQSAFNALITLLKVETDDKVISNATASIILVASTDGVKIKQLLTMYGSLSQDKKNGINSALLSNEGIRSQNQLAWKGILLTAKDSGSMEEKASANELWTSVSNSSPYKD